MKKQKILLIITGSVAAYKAMDLIRLLGKKSCQVTCVLTKAACEFITPLLASALSGHKTYNELFSVSDELEMGHINLSRQSDLIVVAPATADFIAKMAHGYSDDLASAIVLAANKKIIIAPAMNEKMWHNQQTQKNLARLLESGVTIVEPETDILACGEFGIGKMSAPPKICSRIFEFLAEKKQLQNKKILITGGATFEAIDLVRFIGNYSSGKQSVEIVRVLDKMGADVKLIAANIKETIPLSREKIIRVKSAAEMFDAVQKNLVKTEIFIACAAVSDFRVKKIPQTDISQAKIKKSQITNLTLELEKNPDILEFVGNDRRRPQLVIGFAAESSNLEKYAQEKLQKKNCDLIVANDIEDGKIFGSSKTTALFVTKKGSENLGTILKSELAKLLASKIVKLLE
jgi:phosphopantothenoylcysteine decarboxylase/phosphopantothenate--cysteine ligase